MVDNGRREVSDIHPEGVRPVGSVVLTPNYEVTAQFIAELLIDGSHERPAVAMYSLIEQIRYLTATDPAAVGRLLSRLGARMSAADRRSAGVDRNG